MKRPAAPLVGIALLVASCSSKPHPTGDRLITGKSISPSTQSSQDVGSLPMNVMLTPDGRFVISSDMGHNQSLWSTRTSDGKGVSHVDFSNRTAEASPGGESESGSTTRPSTKTNGLYYGLAIDPGGETVYAAQGGHDRIAVLKLSRDGALALRDSIPTRAKDFPAGLALDNRGCLYVANNASGEDNPYKLTGSVAIYDAAAKKELGRYAFSQSHFGTSNFPLGIAALRDGSKAYVAAERDDAVYVLDTRNPAKPALAATLETGAHPVAVLLSRDQKRLHVANSLGDTVSIVDTHADRVIATVLLRPGMAKDLPGITPTALALSPDQKTLYAALGDMNAVAVIDPMKAELRGYIPTGWYPSALVATADGKRLLVANAKGFNVRNPNNKPRRTSLTVLEGNVCSIRIPGARELKETTAQVLADNRMDVLAEPKPNPLAAIGLSAGKIKHVLYIIKENRTYDQVLSDLPQGNGDPSLLLFGRDITPNQHALAERFVLLDNLYACGEVSGDGWDWSTQGMANAYVIRNVPYNYSHRGRKFDEEGQNNGYPTAGAPATDENGKPWPNPAFQKPAPPIPDVANTGRNLWDAARDARVSVRNYGFFLSTAGGEPGVPGAPDNYPGSPGLLPAGHDLAGVSDVDYRRFDLDFADSDAPENFFKQSGDEHCLYSRRTYGKIAMPSRFSEWNREFQMMLAKDPAGGSAVPALMLIRLPQNHTQGAKAGKHSPRSEVADNDYGLGQIVQAVSNSPIWSSTAIFVIEDDAQAGVDHVDCHRTIAFVISPWIKAHSVDHHFYNTDSMLKTIELLLGLHPLSQYDAVADPIMDWNTSPTNAAPFTAAIPSKQLIAELNPQVSALPRSDPRLRMAKQSEAMDFTHADAAPSRQLNEIVWKTVKGPPSHMPAPRGFATGQDAADDD